MVPRSERKKPRASVLTSGTLSTRGAGCRSPLPRLHNGDEISDRSLPFSRALQFTLPLRFFKCFNSAYRTYEQIFDYLNPMRALWPL